MTKRIKLGRFQINLSDRTSYTLIALVSIILLGVGIYAVAPNPGHTASQIDWSELIPQIKTSSLCLGSNCRTEWSNGSCPSGYSFIIEGDQAICTRTDWEVSCTCWEYYGQDLSYGGGVTCNAKRDANGLIWVKVYGTGLLQGNYESCSSDWINGMNTACNTFSYSPEYTTGHGCLVGQQQQNPMQLHGGSGWDAANVEYCQCTTNIL